MAGRYDWRINQGEDLSKVFTWRDENDALVNLTGYSARLQVRKPKGSSTTLLSLTNGSGITLGGVAGTITITRTAAQTAALDWDGSAHYDLELVSGGNIVTRLLEGQVALSREVTR